MNRAYEWYQLLDKPFFAPPSDIFGVAWGILYPIIFISFGYVLYLILQKKLNWKVGIPFALNAIYNAAYSPLMFGLRDLVAASVDIVLALVTIIWMIQVIRPHVQWVAWAQVPYLLWVSFATILQISISFLNV